MPLLYILIAQELIPNIHNLRYSSIQYYTSHIKDVVQRCHFTWITIPLQGQLQNRREVVQLHRLR